MHLALFLSLYYYFIIIFNFNYLLRISKKHPI